MSDDLSAILCVRCRGTGRVGSMSERHGYVRLVTPGGREVCKACLGTGVEGHADRVVIRDWLKEVS